MGREAAESFSLGSLLPKSIPRDNVCLNLLES